MEAALDLFRKAAAGSDPALAQAAIAVVIPGNPASGNQSILDARRTWAERHLSAPTIERAPRSVRARDRPLRIGYISSFFQDHNWMKPVWGFINHHDPGRFGVHLFSDAPASGIRYGYRPDARDIFHDTTKISNQTLARLIEDSEIDLLVDLNGYSAMDRLQLFECGRRG